ncbi:hypothetical protein ACEPAG_2250 [Sanghuangporus baumii]
MPTSSGRVSLLSTIVTLESMTLSKTASDAAESTSPNTSGQYSKFSINQDRPAKRRRNAREAEAGPSSSSSAPGSSAGVSQAEKDVVKNKDGSVPVAARSCAECRRMKLKCDRIFPCKTCVRRGLEGICPEGSLVTGRGTRYVLASTQELHEKILKMSDRIKSLEDALGALHQEHSNCRPCTCQAAQKRNQPEEPHPLLRADLLLIKGQLELYGLNLTKEQSSSPRDQTLQAESPLSQQDVAVGHEANGFRKETTDSEIDPGEESDAATELKQKNTVIGEATENEGSTRRTGNNFQRQIKESPADRGKRLRAMLPPRDEAEHLVREAVWNGAWILNITSRPATRAKLLHDLYHGPLEEVRAQDVALALAALAIGERVDLGPVSRDDSLVSNVVVLSSPHTDSNLSGDRNHASDTPDLNFEKVDHERNDIKKSRVSNAAFGKHNKRLAQESYHLAKAALNEVPVQGEPDQTVVHCLYLMGWYLSALADNKDAGREAIVVVDLAVKIAFKIGMHLEETYANLSPEIQQERRVLFWGLLHLEARLRLDASSLGALGTAKITTSQPRTDTHGAIRSFPTRTEATYHDYKLRFLEECIVPTLSIVEKAPKLRLKDNDYYEILEVDRKIRDFEIPTVLAEPISAPPPPDSSDFLPLNSHTNLNFILNPATTLCSFSLNYSEGKAPRNVLRMIRVKAQQEKLITLLYLHRTFFYAHIRDHRPLVQRMFLPSCLAVFSVACELIRSVKDIYDVEPELAARVSMFWYNAFLAVINLFLLVVYKPFCPVSIIALQEMERARNLFLEASTNCHMAAQSYPLLREFHDKASEVYNRWKEESEGDMGVFGPNGEVTMCQTRIDVVIDRLQCVSVPSSTEEDATTGLLSLKKCMESSSAKQGKSCERSQRTPCNGPKVDDEPSYEMWKHVHREITNLVRRVPAVLRDAAIDPRRATAARLIWGFIPVPEEPKPDDMTIVEEPEIESGLPSDLDWNAFADALMFAQNAHPQILGGSPMQIDQVSPPLTTHSPESSQSNFSLFEFRSDFDFSAAGPSGLTPEVNMESTWSMPDEDLIRMPRNYDHIPFGALRNDAMLGPVDILPQVDAAKILNGLEHDGILSPDSFDLDDGTLGYLWQHRIQSPYLS